MSLVEFNNLVLNLDIVQLNVKLLDSIVKNQLQRKKILFLFILKKNNNLFFDFYSSPPTPPPTPIPYGAPCSAYSVNIKIIV